MKTNRSTNLKIAVLAIIVMFVNTAIVLAQATLGGIGNAPYPVTLHNPIHINSIPNGDPLPVDTNSHNTPPFSDRFSNSSNGNAATNSSLSDNMKVYPNPSDGRFMLHFHTDMSGNLSIKIADVTGKEVMNQTLVAFNGDYTSQCDLSSLGKGLYMVSIEQNNVRSIKKIIVN